LRCSHNGNLNPEEENPASLSKSYIPIAVNNLEAEFKNVESGLSRVTVALLRERLL